MAYSCPNFVDSTLPQSGSNSNYSVVLNRGRQWPNATCQQNATLLIAVVSVHTITMESLQHSNSFGIETSGETADSPAYLPHLHSSVMSALAGATQHPRPRSPLETGTDAATRRGVFPKSYAECLACQTSLAQFSRVQGCCQGCKAANSTAAKISICDYVGFWKGSHKGSGASERTS